MGRTFPTSVTAPVLLGTFIRSPGKVRPFPSRSTDLKHCSVGGRVLSEFDDGFLFDVGPTIVTDNYTEYMELVRDVGLSDKLIDCPPQMAVVKGSDLHILDTRKPLRSFLTTKLLPSAAKLQLIARGVRLIKPLSGMNPYDLSNRVHYDTESIEAYIDRIFGRELNDLWG